MKKQTEEKLREYRVGYKKYVIAFREEKKINNVKNGVRQLTYNQYKRTRNEDKLTNKQIIKKQTKLHTEAQKKKTLKLYQQFNLKPGEKAVFDDTYWGSKSARAFDDPFKSEGLNYHRSLAGLLGDDHALHFLIAGRISGGEDKEKVLEDYGY